ncbi:MAG: hypothetical protein HEQ34_02090 [Sphingorhabdus sp.]|uniref:hypothetical protein n=1 Tax=Sphingorhabdus sp. TaxID=1902408 RepID=UPI0025D259C9|nr:hypothetical protein [Sphingorhabdus sp.]MCO4090729.1 hypothetical protein [Sphingorhabdus sp.]
MSRLLVAAAALSASVVSAQPVSDDEIAERIEKARRIIAVDEDGCVKYPATDEIVVCGENPDNKSQRMFTDRGPPDENRIRPGEAVSQLRAACCSPIPKIPPFWTSSFGYVPPPAIPLEEVLKGLPEPDMIVTDGENAPP